jgi:hypothetical protein
MSFYHGTPKLGVSKFPKLRLLAFWGAITSYANLQLRLSLKQICSPHREFSCTQVNPGDSWLLVVQSQIANLTPDLSFSHNLWFKYSNGSCKPILDIYVSRSFQWYKKNSIQWVLTPWNYSLKVPILKMGAHLGVCGLNPSHYPTLLWTWNVTFGLHF